MEHAEFFMKFGRSTRSKNLAPSLWRRMTSGRARRRSGRKFPRPSKSGLPLEFIRLCPWESEYLFAVGRRSKVGILETGRYNGGSAFLLACAAPLVPIYSIDIAPKNDALVRSMFELHGVGANVDMIVGDSQHAQYAQVKDLDLIFIDGDHTYEGCTADLNNWYGHLVPGGHVMLHDSYIGAWGVQDAILDFLAKHPELSIIMSPIIGPTYWNYPAGSIAHLMKR